MVGTSILILIVNYRIKYIIVRLAMDTTTTTGGSEARMHGQNLLSTLFDVT